MRKCNFTWELKGAGWKWVASHYEGGGIFYGKVTSPYVPYGEYGTWYYWEIKQNGAVLTSGSQADVDKLLSPKGTQKAMAIQQGILGEIDSSKNLVKNAINKGRGLF